MPGKEHVLKFLIHSNINIDFNPITMAQKFTKAFGLVILTTLTGFLNAQTTDWNWSPAGPIYTAGRIRNMIVDKTDPSGKTLYAGSTSSGIFKTTDGGTRWYSLNDQSSVKNISYMAQSFDGTLYAATGEGFLRLGQKAKAQAGTGLYKLSGNTLLQVESSVTLGTVINRIACHPTLSHIAVASDKGIYISLNGGAFGPAPGIPTGTLVNGMDVKFDGAGILYCSVGNETGVNTPGANTATISGRVYRSTDASLSNFIDITPTSPYLQDANYGRIEIAIAPSNNNVVYVSCANKNTSVPTDLKSGSATLNGLFITYNAGSGNPSWGLVKQFSSQLDPSSNGGTIASGDYAHVLLVNPTNPDQLFIGSYSFYVYTRTGGTNSSPVGSWSRVGQNDFSPHQYYLHENIHDIKIIPGNPQKFYFVTDAGIYRSIDFATASEMSPPSFQPFYKGLSTGQFNSVSIERFPLADSTRETKPGTKIKPYSGFIGGSAGNGLIYYSGKDTLVSKETSYLTGDIYNSEYSKILNGAAFMSTAKGNIYSTSNARVSSPTLLQINKYGGILSKNSPTAVPMNNSGFSSGTAFRLWENYGQRAASPDSAIFYNDSARVATSVLTFTDLAVKKEFTFSLRRPNNNKSALIDSIVIRTATIEIVATPAQVNTPFNTGQDITIALPRTYSLSSTSTLTVFTGQDLTTTGPVHSTIQPSVTLNSSTLSDEISVTFSAAPFANKTQTSATVDNGLYYTVFATVFYKYKTGDTVRCFDNSISTKSFTYEASLKKPLRWDYFDALTVYTLTAPIDPSIPNPTFVLTPGNITQSNPTFTVTPMVKTNYVITQTGSYSSPSNAITYTISAIPLTVYSIAAIPNSSANPVSYTLSAVPNPSISNSIYHLFPPGVGPSSGSSPIFTVAPETPTNYTITQTGSGTQTVAYTYSNSIGGYTYVLNPGNMPQSATTFTVAPPVLTNYAITQLGTTLPVAPVTYSTIGTTTYILNPGNSVQTTPVFIVTPTITTTYTLKTLSSNTLSAANSTTLFTFLSAKTFSNGIGATTSVPFSPVNPRVRIATRISARLAFVLKNPENTAGKYAVVVSKNPLSLNNPLDVVRISQSGCRSDDPLGNPGDSIITIPGKPVILEWSKSGTELYYATDDNKLYRVSHITDIFDLSSSSYSGKFFTDVFTYQTSTMNPASPYRTTLIGKFDKPVTSISVSNDDKNLVVTFNPAGSGTTGIVLYNTNDARTSDNTTINWVDKGSALTTSFTASYCSLVEKDDSKKVFIGTDNGVFYTSDITSGNWINANDNASTAKLPNVQVFDIEQQTLNGWDCYNSGQIYVATNGRGIWINKAFFTPYALGIYEEERSPENGNTFRIYPNPTNGEATLLFNSVDHEHARISIMDLSGRIVKSEDLGKLNPGEVSYAIETSGLNAGVYLVNVSSDTNTRRSVKLIVTR